VLKRLSIADEGGACADAKELSAAVESDGLVALSAFKGDGRGLLALLHSFDPKRAPYRPAASPDAQARSSRNFGACACTLVTLFLVVLRPPPLLLI